LQLSVRELFPNVEKFSTASPEQQDQVLHTFDDKADTAADSPQRHGKAVL